MNGKIRMANAVVAGFLCLAPAVMGASVISTIDSGGGRSSSASYGNVGSIGIIEGTSAAGGTVVFHGFIAQLESGIVAVIYPPGDVNGDMRVTGADSLLINQVLVGLRGSTSAVFQITGYLNGDVNATNGVTGADSLLINQFLVGLRSFITTKIVPDAHASNQTTAVTIYGIGFPTNGTVTAVNIGAPVNLPLSNVVVLSREKITANVPPGGGLGTGTVNVISSPTNGVISFGRFINQ